MQPKGQVEEDHGTQQGAEPHHATLNLDILHGCKRMQRTPMLYRDV